MIHIGVEHDSQSHLMHNVLFLPLLEIVEELYFHCSFSVCVSVSVCVCVGVCVCVRVFERFAKWLLTTLAQTLLKLVTLGQRSR